jgi:hypothetical protein
MLLDLVVVLGNVWQMCPLKVTTYSDRSNSSNLMCILGRRKWFCLWFPLLLLRNFNLLFT